VVMQITMCEQLTSYLTKFTNQEETVVTNISVDAGTAELEGLKVFKKADVEVSTVPLTWISYQPTRAF
jgi:hypothetical protein